MPRRPVAPSPFPKGTPVRLNQAGTDRYPTRKGQYGVVETVSKAAPGMVAVRWNSGTVDYHAAKYLERDDG